MLLLRSNQNEVQQATDKTSDRIFDISESKFRESFYWVLPISW